MPVYLNRDGKKYQADEESYVGDSEVPFVSADLLTVLGATPKTDAEITILIDALYNS